MRGETGTKENPWKLKTPPLTSDYEMYRAALIESNAASASRCSR